MDLREKGKIADKQILGRARKIYSKNHSDKDNNDNSSFDFDEKQETPLDADYGVINVAKMHAHRETEASLLRCDFDVEANRFKRYSHRYYNYIHCENSEILCHHPSNPEFEFMHAASGIKPNQSLYAISKQYGVFYTDTRKSVIYNCNSDGINLDGNTFAITKIDRSKEDRDRSKSFRQIRKLIFDESYGISGRLLIQMTKKTNNEDVDYIEYIINQKDLEPLEGQLRKKQIYEHFWMTYEKERVEKTRIFRKKFEKETVEAIKNHTKYCWIVYEYLYGSEFMGKHYNFTYTGKNQHGSQDRLVIDKTSSSFATKMVASFRERSDMLRVTLNQKTKQAKAEPNKNASSGNGNAKNGEISKKGSNQIITTINQNKVNKNDKKNENDKYNQQIDIDFDDIDIIFEFPDLPNVIDNRMSTLGINGKHKSTTSINSTKLKGLPPKQSESNAMRTRGVLDNMRSHRLRRYRHRSTATHKIDTPIFNIITNSIATQDENYAHNDTKSNDHSIASEYGKSQSVVVRTGNIGLNTNANTARLTPASRKPQSLANFKLVMFGASNRVNFKRTAPIAPKHIRYEPSKDPFAHAFDLVEDMIEYTPPTMAVKESNEDNSKPYNDMFSTQRLFNKYQFIKEIGYGR